MRRLVLPLLCIATTAVAQTSPAPLSSPPAATLANAPKLPPAWEQKTREIYQTAVEIPTVAGRGHMPKLADYLADQLRAAGWADGHVRVVPYVAPGDDSTAALIARWPAEGKAKHKPMLIIAHMDVVEALPGDWTTDPFKLVEKDGYFYGRGSSDDKGGLVPSLVALLKLRQSGFKPNRDIVLFYTGDEETEGKGAELGATEWRKWTEAEFVLNADGGGGGFTRDGKPLGFGLQTSEKTYQDYYFRVRNPGGHSSRPRPDNAIYDLAAALEKLRRHRFTPMLTETTRAYFTARAKQEGNSALGQAMRRWLADPNDGEAADSIEANPLEVGITRTRCVATMLKGGHAANALPQLAEATVNCRIMPGIEPPKVQAELQQTVGPTVEVIPYEDTGRPTPVSPLRPDVVKAYTDAVHARFPNQPIIPHMSTGATDGLEFRARGMPVYGVDGGWGVSPDDERAHGKDERLAVQALWDDVLHWERMVRELARLSP
ncbi:MAG TPA: M20/M25/M40 family metallo-hydrolase [Gemmatimonadales bacterium]|nr:M20/M25/M40 family metallo-hydrolase [Gemmatimonadales bacterium]